MNDRIIEENKNKLARDPESKERRKLKMIMKIKITIKAAMRTMNTAKYTPGVMG